MSAWTIRSVIAMLAMLSYCEVGAGENATPQYAAAYLEDITTKPPKLILFPITGPELVVALPGGLTNDFHPTTFSADGKAIYGQVLQSCDGITKIEFKPARQTLVPGSLGIGTIGSLVEFRPSGKIFVSGFAKTRGTLECGIFEIDPISATFKKLFTGPFPDCGGAISPDGNRVLRSLREEGNLLKVQDLQTGAVQPIGRDMTGPSWSPDGRWIAAIRNVSGSSDVVLIDAANTSRRRTLGGTSALQAQWSPDSKYLLLSKLQEIRCGWFTASLEVVEVQTGKRREIKSSHCRIYHGLTGWMDLKAVR